MDQKTKTQLLAYLAALAWNTEQVNSLIAKAGELISKEENN
jgi:hypothetical protein